MENGLEKNYFVINLNQDFSKCIGNILLPFVKQVDFFGKVSKKQQLGNISVSGHVNKVVTINLSCRKCWWENSKSNSFTKGVHLRGVT